MQRSLLYWLGLIGVWSGAFGWGGPPARALAAPVPDPPGVSAPGPMRQIRVYSLQDPAVAAAARLQALVRAYGQPRPPRDPAAEARAREINGADDPAGASGKAHVNAGPGTGGGDADMGTGWLPYSGAWTMDEAAQLMRRCVYGARFEEIQAARSAGLSAAVAGLLQPGALPPMPAPWALEPVPDTDNWTQAMRDSLNELYWERKDTLRYWWVGRIAAGPNDITESMTHFWHDHFATRADVVWAPQSVYLQNDLLRRYAVGNFKTLVRQICTDPAMLIFLDGAWNEVGYTNENFARELLELFTMGEGSGYTQDDVEEVSRACTGWKTDGLHSFLAPWAYDSSPKTILGQTGNWGMDDIVRILFEQPATSRYVVRKLYQWYVGQYPNASDLNTLSELFRRSDFEIKPVLEAILKSRQFYAVSGRGALVSDGVDLFAGQVRRFHVNGFNPAFTPNIYQQYWLAWQMWDYGHVLMNPPNVAGWPGYRFWINSETLPLRKLYGQMLLEGELYGNAMDCGIDVMVETNRLTNPNDPNAIVDDLSRLCFGIPPSPQVRSLMLQTLLQGAQPGEWSMNLPNAPERLHDLYVLAMRLPEYQLK